MKLLTIVFCFFSFGVCAQQHDLEWVGRSQFDTIEMPGRKFLFYQLCAKNIDSLMWNSTAIHSNGDLKNVGDCLYAMTFRDTILYKTTVKVKGRKEQRNLAAYYTQLTGEKFIPVTFGWTKCNTQIIANGVPVCAIFESSNRRKAKMTLTIAEN